MIDPIPLKTDMKSDKPSPMASLSCRNMIAIASGKGGVGKTWLSITLSHALARRNKKTLLFDGDLGLANVDIQLGLTPDKDLGAVVDGGTSLASAVTHFPEGGFDILAGRSGSGSLASMTTQKIAELRNDLIALARNYDNVLIDLGAGVDRSVRQLAGPAAFSLIVVTDEPTSLTDAYAFIKLARAANPHADMRIVVNMAANNLEGQKTYETIRKACENFLHYDPPLVGIIRRDTKVRDAIRAQMPLLTRSPLSEAAADIEAIAAQLRF
jgi:flagellar biosynthesis protein FlhG